MQFPRDPAAFGFLRIHQARRQLLQFPLFAQLEIAAAGLPFEPGDVDRAPQHQQETAAEGDGKRPRQALLSVRELRHKSAIDMQKALSIPRAQLS